MACQSMLIVLVGSTPEYRIEQLDAAPSSQQELLQRVVFTEDLDTIVTEVREPGFTCVFTFTQLKLLIQHV